MIENNEQITTEKNLSNVVIKPKKKKVGLIILFLFLFIVLIVLGYFVYDFNIKNKELTKLNKNLKIENKDLKTKNKDLKEKVESIKETNVVYTEDNLNPENDNSKMTKVDEELIKQIIQEGKKFYEDFYYSTVTPNESPSEIEGKIAYFKDMGLKIDMSNLTKSDVVSKEVMSKLDTENRFCNKVLSKVIIYPQEPFTINSYKIELELDCIFKK